MIPALSVVMIVKDEEGCLARCLKSIEGAPSITTNIQTKDGVVKAAEHG